VVRLRRQREGTLSALSPTRFSWAGSIVEFSIGDGVMKIDIHHVESTERGTRRK
jgi:hypothetical protein